MIPTNIKEDYIRAMRMGLKEQKEAEASGLPTTPSVLDEVFPDAARASIQNLGVREIPIERIVGTKYEGWKMTIRARSPSSP